MQGLVPRLLANQGLAPALYAGVPHVVSASSSSDKPNGSLRTLLRGGWARDADI